MNEYEKLQRDSATAVTRLHESNGREVNTRLDDVIRKKRLLAEYVRTHFS